MIKALDLPEITGLIGQFLDNKTLLSCILVSCSFHKSFIPFLWQSTAVTPLTDLATLRSHAHYIRHLSLNNCLPYEYYITEFPHLIELTIWLNRRPLTKNGLSLDYSPLGHLNPSIKKLRIRGQHSTSHLAFWDAVFAVWTAPKSLHLSSTSIAPEAVDSFWRACTRFEAINFSSHVDIPPSIALPTLSFPRLKSLSLDMSTFRHKSLLEPLDQLAFIKACPNLVHLSWVLFASVFPILPFKQALHCQTWPKLISLSFTDDCIPDADLANIVELIPGLKAFKSRGGAFRSGAFGDLAHSSITQHHCRNLESLNVVKCVNFTGAMAQDILSLCPLLKSFSANCINLKDIIQSSRPWVCQQLESLQILFVKLPEDPVVWEQEVCKRLSRLRQLTSLGATWTHCYDRMKWRSCRKLFMDFTLKSGLGYLASLQKLEEFNFESARSSQEMGIDEVQWMIDHWKRLKRVSGTFSRDHDRNHELLAVLRRHGLKC